MEKPTKTTDSASTQGPRAQSATPMPSPPLPDSREVLRAARTEVLGHSMAQRLF